MRGRLADRLCRQVQAGARLLGLDVRFAHETTYGPVRRVESVASDGMVTLDGMEGRFAPHLFVVVPLTVETLSPVQERIGGRR